MTDAQIKRIVDHDLLTKTASVMEVVYKEAPHNWKAGLHVDQFEAVHPIISKEARVVGFAAWQKVAHPTLGTVGYYSVGVLPAYRGKGLAKQACTRLIAHHKHEVTQFRALIEPGNEASEKLAKSLGVEVDREDPRTKQAGLEEGAKILEWLRNAATSRPAKMLGGAAAGAGLGELASQEESKHIFGDSANPSMGYISRAVNLPIGALGGAIAGSGMSALDKLRSLGGIGLGYGAKTMGLGALDAYNKDAPLRAQTALNALEASKLDKERASVLTEGAKHMSPRDLLLAGGLGLGGLGLGLYGYNSLKGKSHKPQSKTLTDDGPGLRHKSKVRIDIPADALDQSFYDSLRGLNRAPQKTTFTQPGE